MNSNLKKQIIENIKNHYTLGKNDFVTVVGSYAIGQETEGSDIDIHIYTKNYEFYQKQSCDKKYTNKGEDAKYYDKIGSKEIDAQVIRLPIKYTVFKLYDLYNEKLIFGNKKEFQKYVSEGKKYFNSIYKNLIRQKHIDTCNTIKQIDGLSRRNDTESISLIKNLFLKDLYQLAILLDKKPYSSDKWIIYNYRKTKLSKKISNELKNLINSPVNKLIDNRRVLINKIESLIPKGLVVDKWWMYLNE